MAREEIPDDPYIRCYERTGYPPWHFYGKEEDDVPEDGEDWVDV